MSSAWGHMLTHPYDILFQIMSVIPKQIILFTVLLLAFWRFSLGEKKKNLLGRTKQEVLTKCSPAVSGHLFHGRKLELFWNKNLETRTLGAQPHIYHSAVPPILQFYLLIPVLNLSLIWCMLSRFLSVLLCWSCTTL